MFLPLFILSFRNEYSRISNVFPLLSFVDLLCRCAVPWHAYDKCYKNSALFLQYSRIISLNTFGICVGHIKCVVISCHSICSNAFSRCACKYKGPPQHFQHTVWSFQDFRKFESNFSYWHIIKNDSIVTQQTHRWRPTFSTWCISTSERKELLVARTITISVTWQLTIAILLYISSFFPQRFELSFHSFLRSFYKFP